MPIQGADIFTHPDSFAITMLVLFCDTYGKDGLEWSPQAIKLQVQDDFGVTLPQANLDRLLAAITLVTTDYFYKRLPYFNEICNILSGDSFGPDVFRPTDVADAAWGLTEAILIMPSDEPEPFTDEIRAYLAKVLQEEGFSKPPDILRLALQDENVHGNFDWSDDEALASATYANQQNKNTEITEMIRDSLQRLMEQLVSLPLQNGTTDNLKEKLRQAIQVAA